MEKYIEILLVRKKLSVSDSRIDENAELYEEEIHRREFILKQEEIQEVLEDNEFGCFYIIFDKKK